MRSVYILAHLTGSDLVDASGRAIRPETQVVISRHRTLRTAMIAQRRLTGYNSAPAILHADGTRLTDAERSDMLTLSYDLMRRW